MLKNTESTTSNVFLLKLLKNYIVFKIIVFFILYLVKQKYTIVYVLIKHIFVYCLFGLETAGSDSCSPFLFTVYWNNLLMFLTEV